MFDDKHSRLQVEGLGWACRAVSPFIATAAVRQAWPRDELWPGILAAADRHRLLPALAHALARRGLRERLDPDIGEALDAIAAWNAEGNAALRAQMLEISAACNAAGTRPVWLKGALALLPPDGPGGGRMMMDLDMWLPDPPGLALAAEALRRLGYAMADPEPFHLDPDFQHDAPLVHPRRSAAVELHRRVVSRSLEAVLPEAEARARIEWLSWEGTRIGRLDPLFAALCALVQATHSGPQPFDSGAIPLQKAFDVVGRLHADFGGEVPAEMVQRLEAAGWGTTARQFFTTCDRCFGLPNPLPPDEANLRAVEGHLRHPRLRAAARALRALLSPRAFAVLRHPSRIPGHVARVRQGRW